MEKIFFKNIYGKRSQPYTIDDFKTRGNLYSDDLIWHEGLDGWTEASKIEDLKEYTISKPPLTNSEINKKSLIKAINPTILYYIIISIIIGVSGALIEKNKYETFINSITKTTYNTTNNYNKDKINLTEYSDVKHSDVYAPIKDGNGYYTRWKVYSTVGNQDNSEQRSYEETYKLLFRPYKTFYEIVNLSNEEIKNTNILLFNFIYSAFVTNLLFIPFLFLLLFFIKRKKINQNDYSIDQRKNYLPFILGTIIFIGIVTFLSSKSIQKNNSQPTSESTESYTSKFDTSVVVDTDSTVIEPIQAPINTNLNIENLRNFNGGYTLDKIEEYEYETNSSTWILLDKTETIGEFYFDDTNISFYRPSYGYWKSSLWTFDSFDEKENCFVIRDRYQQKILIDAEFKKVIYLSNFINNTATYCYIFYILKKSEYVKPK